MEQIKDMNLTEEMFTFNFSHITPESWLLGSPEKQTLFWATILEQILWSSTSYYKKVQIFYFVPGFSSSMKYIYVNEMYSCYCVDQRFIMFLFRGNMQLYQYIQSIVS